MSNVIEIKELSKKYRDFQLENINLTLPSGTIMGLIGENGAGKSTTIKLILDMIKKDSGSVKIFDKENNTSSKVIMEDIGVVFDEMCLPTNVTSLELNSIMKKIYKNWDEKKYVEYIERFQVSKYKTLKELSRGNKMKVSIAVALSHNPKLLILDEATSGLDPVVRDEIIDIFMEFTKDEKRAILISSHIVSDLEKACDYIAFLHKGKLILCDEKDRLKDSYKIVKCSEEEYESIDKEAIIGKKIGKYGVSALVKKEAIPEGLLIENITIEDLFIYITREEKKEERKEINYRARRRKKVLLAVLGTVVVVVLAIGIYNSIMKFRINNAYKYGTASTGYIEVSEENWEFLEEIDIDDGSGVAEAKLKFEAKKWDDFYKDVMNIEGVKAIGDMSLNCYDKDFHKDMLKFAKKQNKKKYGRNWIDLTDECENYFEVVIINKEAFNLYDIEIAKGKKPSELKYKKGEEKIYMYLGAKYKDVKIGTKYVYKHGNFEQTLEVAGILKENSKIVQSELGIMEDNKNRPVVDLDYSALQVEPNQIDHLCYYSFAVEDSKDFDTIAKKIEKVAKKNGIKIRVGKMKERLNKVY